LALAVIAAEVASALDTAAATGVLSAAVIDAAAAGDAPSVTAVYNLVATAVANAVETATAAGYVTPTTPDRNWYVVVAWRAYAAVVPIRYFVHIATPSPTMPVATFPQKDPAEIIDALTFDFKRFGTTVTGATVSITAYDTDDNPEAMLDGAPVISGTKVMQRVIGGVSGVRYRIRCEVDMETGHWADVAQMLVKTF
jgi:hypothetical protein